MLVFWLLSTLISAAYGGDICIPGTPPNSTIVHTATDCHFNTKCGSILINKSEEFNYPLLKNDWLSMFASPSLRLKKTHGTASDYSLIDPGIFNDYKNLAASLGFDKEVIYDLNGHKVK